MRGWVLALLLSGLAGCASVIGLEDAELDEGGNSGRGGSGGGNGGRAGNAGTGGSAPTPECSFKNDNACLSDCWNGDCCEAASACLYDPSGSCGDYLDCTVACADDNVCQADCAEQFSPGFRLANAWNACSLGCGCDLGGSTCTAESPTSCVGEVAVRICGADGMYQTRPCSGLCRSLGFEAGPCLVDQCECGAALDVECFNGVDAFCTCVEGTPDACTAETSLGAYVGCFTAAPTIEPVVRCYASYVVGTQIDCDAAEICLE